MHMRKANANLQKYTIILNYKILVYLHTYFIDSLPLHQVKGSLCGKMRIFSAEAFLKCIPRKWRNRSSFISSRIVQHFDQMVTE